MTQTMPPRGELSDMSQTWEACAYEGERRYCSLERYDPRLLDHPLVDFAVARAVLQQEVWGEETAHPAWRTPPGRAAVKAYGQCVPSSVDMFKELKSNFPEEPISLESGHVFSQMREPNSLIEITCHVHVWLQWLPAGGPTRLEDFYSIDSTSNQIPSSNLPVRIVENLKRLATEQGIIYQAPRRFFTLDEFYDQFSIGEPDVQQRIDQFRERVNQLAG